MAASCYGRINLLLLFCCWLGASSVASAADVEVFDLLMPNVRPEKPETYLCTPIRIETDEDYYVVGFTPNATMHTAHHMLIYGCEEPGSNEETWNCGEMAVRQPGLKTAAPCRAGAQVIYAWAHDAPPLQLPKDVGFHVGGSSRIKYMVLQVHYASVARFRDGTTDDSGVFLHYTSIPQPKTAGVLLMGTGGRIPSKSVQFMETACRIDEDKVIHPFAFRVHTHALGRVVSGYKVQRQNRRDVWTLIGKKDPQKPQMFYPIEDKSMTISRGDTVAARCTMVSDRSRVTRIGNTGRDEMCNFYVMYWTEAAQGLLRVKTCFSAGPPYYYWDANSQPLNNIPDDASDL